MASRRCDRCGSVFDGEGHTVKASFYDGTTTVCPTCYGSMAHHGVYVSAEDPKRLEWRHRASAAARLSKWQKLPTTSMTDAFEFARRVTRSLPVEVEQPGFIAYTVGDWLLAQKPHPDPDRNVYALDLSKGDIVRPSPKPASLQRPEEVHRVTPLLTQTRTPRGGAPCNSLTDVVKDWELLPSHTYTIETGHYLCITTKEGKYWYFEEAPGTIRSMHEYVDIYGRQATKEKHDGTQHD